jgi:hypothetical protein
MVTMTILSVIVIGAALLFEGGAIATRPSRLLQSKSKTGIDAGELGGGISTEFFGGAAGLTLGILVVVDVVPIQLVAIAVLIFITAILGEAVQWLV